MIFSSLVLKCECSRYINGDDDDTWEQSQNDTLKKILLTRV